MKKKILVISVVVVLLTLALFTSVVLAKDSVTPVSGTECMIAVLDPGVSKSLGGNKVMIRGYQEMAEDIADDPRLTGFSYIDANMILDMDTFSGPAWGTFVMENEGGKWYGNWSGELVNGLSEIRAVAHGFGGYEGLVLKMEVYRTEFGDCLNFNGYIKETGNAKAKTVGERILVINGFDGEFPAGEPFHIMHGFWSGYYLGDKVGELGRTDMEIYLDGEYQKWDFKDVSWATYPGFRIREGLELFIYNYPEGLTGEHTFLRKIYFTCGYLAQFFPLECEHDNKLIAPDFFFQTVTIDFVE